MADDIDILVVDDPPQVVADRLVAAARAGGQIVLTGGETPRAAYELAARAEPDWSRTGLWWGDERCVRPDDEHSNYLLANTSLLDHVTAGSVHRMLGELGPEEGAARYEEELDGLEEFDLMLLGMGPDAHIASLYPDQPTLDETERRVVGAEAKWEPFIDRITMTLPMLAAAREVLFMVEGADKAVAVRTCFAEPPSRSAPGSLVRSASGVTTVVLDAGAASLL